MTMSKKQIAIITGASSGMGKEFVKLLLNEKEISEIWAIARNADKLQKLSDEFGGKIYTIPADLSDRNSLSVIKKQLESSDYTIKYLINNAGFAKFCSYDDISIDESLNMIDLNVSAVVGLGLVCIPYMREGSHIINIASQASFQPLPYLNIYSATKAFVRNYTRALNVELKDRKITATAVCPGWMKTAFFDRGIIGAKKTASNFSGIVSPELVAKKALRDVKMGKDMSVYGLHTKTAHFFAKIFPQKTAMRIWLAMQKLNKH